MVGTGPAIYSRTLAGLRSRIAVENINMAPHAWFALAVHEAAAGRDAQALYRQSADRRSKRSGSTGVSGFRPAGSRR